MRQVERKYGEIEQARDAKQDGPTDLLAKQIYASKGRLGIDALKRFGKQRKANADEHRDTAGGFEAG